MQGNELIIRLLDGSEARVPNLTEEELEEIFLGHSKFLELASGPVAEDKSSKQENTFQPEIIANDLFHIGTSANNVSRILLGTNMSPLRWFCPFMDVCYSVSNKGFENL